MKATVNQALEARKIDRTAPPREQINKSVENEKKVRKKHERSPGSFNRKLRELTGIITHKEPYKF